MLKLLIAACPLLFLSAAAAEETAECLSQTRLCDQASGLLTQCQSKHLDCDEISKQADSACASKTFACSEPTYSNNLGTQFRPEANVPKKPAPVPDEIEVGGENTSGFGAIAYSPSARSWGESFGYGSRNDAERRAVKECRSEAKGSGDCQLAVTFYRQCGAVAGDDNGVWGTGLGPTPQLALRDALAACANNNGKECELERVTCTR